MSQHGMGCGCDECYGETSDSAAVAELIDTLQELYDFATVSHSKNYKESRAAFAKAAAVLRKHRARE